MATVSTVADGLMRQYFLLDYISNGLFPCTSAWVNNVRREHLPWNANEQFEYRMLMSGGENSGTNPMALMDEDYIQRRPGANVYDIYKASYGTIVGTFSYDMMAQFETEAAQASFCDALSANIFTARMAMASTYRNTIIDGRFLPVHRITQTDVDVINSDPLIGSGGVPGAGAIFTLKPIERDVYTKGYKTNRYLIKTSGNARDLPWGEAKLQEQYMIVDCQPDRLTLVALPGSVPTEWMPGDWLECADNRVCANGENVVYAGKVPLGASTTDPFYGISVYGMNSAATPNVSYTWGENAVTYAMEGTPDLFPWYTSVANPTSRAEALQLPFRYCGNRQAFSTERAAGFVAQEDNEPIIDTILRGVALVVGTIGYEGMGTFINRNTLTAIGYQEGTTGSPRTIRDLTSGMPIAGVRGTKEVDMYFGSKHIPMVEEDDSLPSDVIIIGAKKKVSYVSRNNVYADMEEFIKDGGGPDELVPRLLRGEQKIPKEFTTSLDQKGLIIYGKPYQRSGNLYAFGGGGTSGIMHPGNYMPVAMYEHGTLFCRQPYQFCIVKLRAPIVDPTKAYPII